MQLNPINTLPTSPLLTVYLTGLLIINPLNHSSCQVAVHPDALTTDPREKHELKIGLKVNLPDHGVLRVPIHKGPLTQQPFRINVINPTVRDLYAYQGDAGRDLRLAVNIEGGDYHSAELSVDMSKIQSVVLIDNGGIFYTAERTDIQTFPRITRRRGGISRHIDSLGSVIGVAIEVAALGGMVQMTWYESSGGITSPPLELPRSMDPVGTTYELFIRNQPPDSTMTESDELKHYYEVLKDKNGADIPEGEQWKLELKEVQTRKLDEIPCMPIIKNGVQ